MCSLELPETGVCNTTLPGDEGEAGGCGSSCGTAEPANTGWRREAWSGHRWLRTPRPAGQLPLVQVGGRPSGTAAAAAAAELDTHVAGRHPRSPASVRDYRCAAGRRLWRSPRPSATACCPTPSPCSWSPWPPTCTPASPAVTGALHVLDRGRSGGGDPDRALAGPARRRALMTAGSVARRRWSLGWSQVGAVWQLYAVWSVSVSPRRRACTRRRSRSSCPGSRRTAATRALLAVTIVAGFASSVFLPTSGFLMADLGWHDAVLVLAAVHAALTVPFHRFVRRPSLPSMKRHPRR